MLQCTICHTFTETINSHHTIPRSRGGENSLQIPLCGDCHDNLHAAAVFQVSRIRRPSRKRQPKNFFPKPEDAERAQPFLEILVTALLQPIPEGLSREHLVSASIDTNTYEALMYLKQDIGASSLEKVIVYCLQNTLKAKEVLNETQKQHLWFLPISHP